MYIRMHIMHIIVSFVGGMPLEMSVGLQIGNTCYKLLDLEERGFQQC